MKNNKAKKSQRSKKLRLFVKHHPRKTALLVAISLGLVLFVTVTVVHSVQTHVERNKFLQAKADLDTIYNEIVSKVGKPDAHKADQSCHYSSAKFSKGQLSCSVSEYMFYSTDSREASLGLANKIQEQVGSSSLISENKRHSQSSLNFFEGAILFTSFQLGQFKGCGSYYYYGNEIDNISLPGFIVKTNQGVSLRLSCDQTAKAEHFHTRR